MSIFTSYSEAVRVHYVSTLFSKATALNVLALMTVVVAPYLISYRTQGFWTRLETVREQPIIEFKYETLLVLEAEDKDAKRSSIIWSTFPGLMDMLTRRVTPFIMSREGDANMDGIYEFLDLEIQLPLSNGEKIHGLHFFLLFDYRLYRYATFQMESLAYGSYQTGRSASRFDITGDLTLVQRQPLWNRFRDTRYNYEVIPRNGTSPRDYHLRSIIEKYTERNVTTILANKYEFWTLEDGHDEKDFTFKARIFYPEQSYECWAGFWTTMKWAWIQYFSIFVIVALLVKTLQRVVYKARLFETRLILPWEKSDKHL